ACGAEEDHVGGLELRERDPLRRGNLAAHRVRRPTFEDVRELSFVRIRLELVDAPDEARAVEAAVYLPPVRRVRRLALAAPDVGKADESHRGVEDLLLPGRVDRQDERLCGFLDRGDVPLAELEDARGGVRGLGVRGRLARRELELVERRRMVRPQAE